jgi:hypothetical protein
VRGALGPGVEEAERGRRESQFRLRKGRGRKAERTTPNIVVHDKDVVEKSSIGGDVADGVSVGTDVRLLSGAGRETGVGEGGAQTLEEEEKVRRVGAGVVGRVSSGSRVLPAREGEDKSESVRSGKDKKAKQTSRCQLRRGCKCRRW